MLPPEEEFGRRVISKVMWRLIPFIFICYVVAYIDRFNVGFAANALKRDFGFTGVQYANGSGLFFIGYFLLEIPSNLILHRVGARVWIARIMIVWGLVSMAMMFIKGVWSFYGMRVLLGLAEAGFFPGMVLYLTYWIPARHRARAGALFMIAGPFAALIQSPISVAIMEHMNQVGGLRDWQWLFILEGVPAILLGLLTLWALTDRPEKAKWLTDEERDWLVRELAKEPARTQSHGGTDAFRAMLDPKVLVLCVIYMLNTYVTYGIFFWLPKMLQDLSGYKGGKLMLVNSLPFAAAIVGMILISAHSDRTRERKWHVVGCAILGAVGLVMAALGQHPIWLFVLGFAICQIGQRTIVSVFWAIPPAFLGGTAAAAGIALVNSIGNLGGYLGTLSMGKILEMTGGYTGGLFTLAGALVALAIVIGLLRLPREKAAAA